MASTISGRRADVLEDHNRLTQPGDFTTTPRMLFIAVLAIGIGICSTFIAVILLKLIGLFTNLFFYQRWDTTLVSPVGNKLGIFEVLVPVLGGLVIGLMARYGSERIRGHGIPEAIEAILINGSKVEPKVAILKPISSAISIGSGGPFGAEGPIIMTGGAFGSMIAQLFHLTSVERKTLLVAGAAAGMSATFASPIAAILLAVELLLFEWKPRSLVPVALASAAAAILRHYLLGSGPLFPVPAHSAFIGPTGFLGCVVAGLLAGGLSSLLTLLVYAFEDLFHRLPIHWMWWPMIGGLVIGIGGLIFPQALGVGYDTIGSLLQGNVSAQIILGVLLVKSIIWCVSLGSGTSGGVLAPLLMMGCALGGIEAMFLPHEGAGFWALISMAAILGGTMRSPFTGIIFALELTHDVNALLPLVIAVIIAHAFTVLLMRRSILTEKISRRGYHLSREYAIDPLELIFAREVMRTDVVALSDTLSHTTLPQLVNGELARHERMQHLYPVLNKEQLLVGVVTRYDLQRFLQQEHINAEDGSIGELIQQRPVVAYPDEPLRHVINRMAASGFTRLPVVESEASPKLLGMISLSALLKARSHNLEEERLRERPLHIRLLLPRRGQPSKAEVVEEESIPG
ncbi:chloride channel protein [Dictyobacter kobayashii]|uniref:Chloride channel protein n=1 Tax=Dictyobacter kobayashii TaxID=2014872 RepID=A0A402ADC8_9CHLR|nr:chloride channel protein [Dictyobacter kobayashii]GCE17093.1 chloride channel protein [Dictyobacter kobayashii]